MKVKNDVNEELKFQSNLFSINYDGTCGKREHKLEYWIFIRFFLNFILYENQCFCCVYMCCKFVCSLIFLSYILLSKCNFPFDNDFNVCSDNFKQKSALFSWHQNFWFRKYTKIKVKIQHAWMAWFSYLFLLSIVLICFRFCFGKHKHTRSKLLFQLELITLSQVNVVQHTHFVSNYFLFLINFFVSNYFLFSTILI